MATHSRYVTGMQTGSHIPQVAALIGDPARANVLTALMDGRALTATELSHAAGITPQTASAHLAKLSDARLLMMERQGRHRYYRLASPLVRQMLEGIMAVAEAGPARDRPHWRGGETLRRARTCYDHLAGRLAVAVADAMVQHGHLILDGDGGEVTPAGMGHMRRIGIDIEATAKRRRAFCRPCLDWSERRPHLAGGVGAALLDHALEAKWVERIKDSRALSITNAGRRGFADVFGVALGCGSCEG